jgi:hypothetical protein
MNPTGCEAANPSAQTICCSLSPQKLASGNGGAKLAYRSGAVPATIIMFWPHSVEHAEHSFHAQNESIQTILA